MAEKVEGIVLGVVRHNDRYNIVTLYTREHGRMAFLSPAGTGKSARLRNARLLSLAVIESDVRINPAKELVLLGKFSSPIVWKNLYFNPIKQTLVLFLKEFLDKLLRTSVPDTNLYSFLITSIQAIDRSEPGRSANLHIALLTGMLDHAGITPNIESFQKGDWFDMRGGEFVAERPLHNDCLIPSEAAFIPVLSRITMKNAAHFRFSADERRRVLSMLVRYYGLHYPGIGNLKCIDILSEVFK